MMPNQKNTKKDQAEGTVTETGTTAKQGTADVKSAKPKESVYTVEEFMASADELFQVPPECVRAALAEKGISECTKREAESTIKTFMKREVK